MHRVPAHRPSPRGQREQMEADDQLPTALDQPQRSPARLVRENEILDNDNRNPITYTRAVARLRQRQPEQFDRLEFLPGEKMQVDHGEGAPTRVPGTEHYRKPRLFVATLRYSRRSFR